MASATDVTEILANAQSPDSNVRNAAESQLKQFQQQNLASYLLSLATEVSSDAKPEHTRQMAGLMLKNSLDAPGTAVKVRRSGLISCANVLEPASRGANGPSMVQHI